MVVVELSREKIITIINVILRVPALFIAEVWCRHDPSLFQLDYFSYISDGREQLIVNVVYNLGKYLLILRTMSFLTST